ncbi:MAG: hypothetical protein U0Q16_08825 [Bryobacteraceae bacterium]
MSTLGAWIGTLILFLPAPHGVYVTADSRYDGGDPALVDRARKILHCGPAGVCAISGALRLVVTPAEGEPVTFDVEKALEEVAETLDEAAAPRSIALRMHAKLSLFWGAHLAKPVASQLSERLHAASVCTILFARREADSGDVSVAQIQFPFVEQRDASGGWLHILQDPVVRGGDAKRPIAQGRTECLKRGDATAETATREATLDSIRRIYGRAQARPECAAVIGGPVDVMVLDSDGVHWLARKQNPVADKEAVWAISPAP